MEGVGPGAVGGPVVANRFDEKHGVVRLVTDAAGDGGGKVAGQLDDVLEIGHKPSCLAHCCVRQWCEKPHQMGTVDP